MITIIITSIQDQVNYMETKKQRQVAELIKRNFGIVMQQEGSFFLEGAFVTVTDVKMSSDLGLAKIYVSIFNAEDKQATIIRMDEYKYKLQQELVTRIRKHVRRIPKIDFYIDDTLDEMDRLNNLFDKIGD